MPVTPRGWWGLMRTDVRDLIAASTSFQTWVGAANATAAQAYIHIIESTSDSDVAMTEYAVVRVPKVSFPARVSTGRGFAAYERDVRASTGFVQTGISAYTEDTQSTFENAVYDIVNDMLNLQDTGGLMMVDSFDEITEPDMLTLLAGDVRGYRKFFEVGRLK